MRQSRRVRSCPRLKPHLCRSDHQLLSRSVIGHAEVAIEDVELERQHNLPPDHPILQDTKKQLEQDLAEQKGKKSKQLAARADLQARKQKRQGALQLGISAAASCVIISA